MLVPQLAASLYLVNFQPKTNGGENKERDGAPHIADVERRVRSPMSVALTALLCKVRVSLMQQQQTHVVSTFVPFSLSFVATIPK